MEDEEGKCPEEPAVQALNKFIPGGIHLTGFIQFVGEVTISPGGNLTARAGTSGSVAVVLEGANATGQVRFMASPGVAFLSSEASSFNTSADAVAHLDFEISEGAPDLVVIPFVVSQAGMADYPSAFFISTVEEEPDTPDTDVTQVAIIAGFLGLLVGAILVAVIMLAVRRN